jgi:hypothetical protein
LVYEQDAVVIEIKADFDPFGGEYTHVSLGYKMPIPRPPEIERVYPPPPRPVMYKHILHVIIPREKWTGQYMMWQEFRVICKDNGEVEVKRKG